MSTYYDFHTEALINGKWHCIDPLILDMDSGTYKLQQTYWNGSRSYFGEAYSWLLQHSTWVKGLDNMSDELKQYLKDDWTGTEEEMVSYYKTNGNFIKLSDIEDSLPAEKHDHHALVSKDAIALHEMEDYELDLNSEVIRDVISPETYAMLPDEARKMWQYYEWDDDFSIMAPIRKIVEKARMRLEDFKDANTFLDIDSVRLFMVTY